MQEDEEGGNGESCGYPDPMAHAVRGTDREPVLGTCFAPYMHAGSSIMDGRSCPPTVALVWSFCTRAGTRNNPQTRREFDLP